MICLLRLSIINFHKRISKTFSIRKNKTGKWIFSNSLLKNLITSMNFKILKDLLRLDNSASSHLSHIRPKVYTVCSHCLCSHFLIFPYEFKYIIERALNQNSTFEVLVFIHIVYQSYSN